MRARVKGLAAPEKRAGEFDGGNLHPQAKAQIGHTMLTGEPRRADLAGDPPPAEPAATQQVLVL